MKTETVIANGLEMSLRFLNELFAQRPLRNVGVRLWDGTYWPDEEPRAVTIALNHPGALRAMFGAGTEKAVGEAYVRGDFDIEGDVEAAFEIGDALAEGAGWKRSVALAFLLHRLPEKPRDDGMGRGLFGHNGRRHSTVRDRQAIAFHYDVSNEFYRLWLDRQMVYSCAYFETPDDDLDTAQFAKLDLLCRKLRLRRGQQVLDIGCGWGGLAMHAARHYGVKVVGVTLSANQAELAQRRIAESGLEKTVQIQLRDYRELNAPERFDAIVSVGMSEHVGTENLPKYFSTAYAMLKPGGVFLNHAIGEGSRYRPSQGPSFIEEYVFPDGDIPPIRAVIAAAEPVGFEVRDVENLREHYALTLRRWVARLEAHHQEALAFVTEPIYRVWRLYMAGSAYGFQHSRLAIYQVLLAKTDASGDAHLPLRRDDWYQLRGAEPRP